MVYFGNAFLTLRCTCLVYWDLHSVAYLGKIRLALVHCFIYILNISSMTPDHPTQHSERDHLLENFDVLSQSQPCIIVLDLMLVVKLLDYLD